MQRSSNDIWVGLFVLIGGAALLFLALQSANLLNLNFQKTYAVTARFDGPHDGTVSVDETRSPALADHIVVQASHSGLLLSTDAMRQTAGFLRHGRFATVPTVADLDQDRAENMQTDFLDPVERERFLNDRVGRMLVKPDQREQ